MTSKSIDQIVNSRLRQSANMGWTVSPSSVMWWLRIDLGRTPTEAEIEQGEAAYREYFERMFRHG